MGEKKARPPLAYEAHARRVHQIEPHPEREKDLHVTYMTRVGWDCGPARELVLSQTKLDLEDMVWLKIA